MQTQGVPRYFYTPGFRVVSEKCSPSMGTVLKFLFDSGTSQLFHLRLECRNILYSSGFMGFFLNHLSSIIPARIYVWRIAPPTAFLHHSPQLQDTGTHRIRHVYQEYLGEHLLYYFHQRSLKTICDPAHI